MSSPDFQLTATTTNSTTPVPIGNNSGRHKRENKERSFFDDVSKKIVLYSAWDTQLLNCKLNHMSPNTLVKETIMPAN